MTVRDIGKKAADFFPRLEALLRKIYLLLPAFLHDTPTARMKQFFTEQPSILFLQIGAYDGVAGDPIRPLLIDDERWRGILVEPQRKAFNQLLQNYSTISDRLKFVNCAIGPAATEKELFFVSPHTVTEQRLPAWFGEIASFSREHVERHAPNVPVASESIEVRTVDQVLAEANMDRLDAVVIDVEGYEAQIIENIDFDSLKVKFLLFEHVHLSGSAKTSVFDRLVKNGFQLKEFGRDVCAWRQQADNSHGL